MFSLNRVMYCLNTVAGVLRIVVSARRGSLRVFPDSFLALLFTSITLTTASNNDNFELDTSGRKVECIECLQLWKSSDPKGHRSCGSHSSTCYGDACFMRQCKHCPVYQYMSGCLQLTPWQLADLEMNRRSSELRAHRFGAILLCEDSHNQTTCVCNRRDKCNSIHSQNPYSTYADGLFKGVVNFDHVIGDLDPRYLEVMSGFNARFSGSNTPFRRSRSASRATDTSTLLLSVFCSFIMYIQHVA